MRPMRFDYRTYGRMVAIYICPALFCDIQKVLKITAFLLFFEDSPSAMA